MPTTSVTIPGKIDRNELKMALPRVCLVCGEESSGEPLSRIFHRWPPAMLMSSPFVLALLGILPQLLGFQTPVSVFFVQLWVFLLFGSGQRVRLATPVCRRHRWH